MKVKKNTILDYVYLHILFVILSLITVASKYVASFSFSSIEFWILSILIIGSLGVYAFFWQKILKTFPLFVAYTNRSVVYLWILFWAAIIFQETVTLTQIIGIGVIGYGIKWVIK